MTWGLIPWFSKDGKLTYSTINARAEGVRTNAYYREPFKTRRCIVPASGYFEWTGPKTDRQPHYSTRADGKPMALAGPWDRWRGADKPEMKETFTIVTTVPSTFAAQFHNRMPLILEPDTWDAWLSGDPETAAALMKSANERVLNSRSVNKAVGNVKNNGPELLTEIPK
jgi:putative SOS response-associated peptidase YedK